MKANQNRKAPITSPLLKDLMDRQNEQSKSALIEVVIGSEPLAPSDLYQDAGSGYNTDFTFPQD